MNIIAKTAPEEAAKVALLSEMSPPAKRRRGRHDFVDFEKGTHDTSQGAFNYYSEPFILNKRPQTNSPSFRLPGPAMLSKSSHTLVTP